jgi:hypothetical protein
VLVRAALAKAKVLLRLLVKELNVNARSEILPTYRVVTPMVCATSGSVERRDRTREVFPPVARPYTLRLAGKASDGGKFLHSDAPGPVPSSSGSASRIARCAPKGLTPHACPVSKPGGLGSCSTIPGGNSNGGTAPAAGTTAAAARHAPRAAVSLCPLLNLLLLSLATKTR